MANDIAVSVGLQNQQFLNGMQQNKQALQSHDQVIGRARVNFLKYESSMRSATKMSGQHRMVLQNSIYMVEDAASVYGTMGLAGAVRAASNNLTMMASAFGPWGMAATVAVTTATQLYMAFNKDAEGAKNAKKEIDEYGEALRKQSDAAAEASQKNRSIREGGRSDLAGQYDDAKGKIEDTKAALENLNKEQRKLVATKVFVVAEGGGGEQGREAFEKKLNDLHKERSRLQEELNTASHESIRIREKLNQQTKWARDRQVEEITLAKQYAKIDEENAAKKAQHDQAEHQRKLELQRVESNRRMNNLLADQDEEKRKQRMHDQEVQRQRMRETAQSTGRGSSDFARSFAATAQSTAGMTKRERMAAEAVARKKEKIENAPRRQIKEQMAARDKQEKSSEKVVKKQEEATKSMDELTEQMREANRIASQRPSGYSLSLGALDS